MQQIDVEEIEETELIFPLGSEGLYTQFRPVVSQCSWKVQICILIDVYVHSADLIYFLFRKFISFRAAPISIFGMGVADFVRHRLARADHAIVRACALANFLTPISSIAAIFFLVFVRPGQTAFPIFSWICAPCG